MSSQVWSVFQEMERTKRLQPLPNGVVVTDKLSLYVITLVQHHLYLPTSACELLSIHTDVVQVSRPSLPSL